MLRQSLFVMLLMHCYSSKDVHNIYAVSDHIKHVVYICNFSLCRGKKARGPFKIPILELLIFPSFLNLFFFIFKKQILF